MAKKVESKKTVKKTTPKKENIHKEQNRSIDNIYKKKKRKQDVLGDSLLKQNAELFNFFKILIGVLIFIGVFYLIIAFARGEIGSKKQTKEEVVPRTIQNEEILATSVFTKKDKEYYVLLFNSKDINASSYASMYNNYKQGNHDVSMFYIDLNNGFNKDIESKETNPKAQNFSELKVSSPTLIHIKNGKNVGYYEDSAFYEQMTKLNKE